MVIALDLKPAGRVKGTALTLTSQAVATLRAEHARRVRAGAQTVTLSVAARMLDLPVTSVETLVRGGKLEQVAAPNGTRHRFVSVASVEAYRRDFPPESAPVADDDVLIPFAVAARVLGVSRPTLSGLTQNRQIRAARKPNNRHVYVVASSAPGVGRTHGDVPRGTRHRTMATPKFLSRSICVRVSGEIPDSGNSQQDSV